MRYGALLNNWEHGGHPLKEQKNNIRACRFRLVGVAPTLPNTTTARKLAQIAGFRIWNQLVTGEKMVSSVTGPYHKIRFDIERQQPIK